MTNTAGPQQLKGMAHFENCMIDEYRRRYLYCYHSQLEVHLNAFPNQNPDEKAVRY